jgi:cyanophycinase
MKGGPELGPGGRIVTLALIGGDEFRPPCDPIDRRLLAARRVGGVRILPTAAAIDRPDLAAQNGVRHFQRLGADDVEAVMVLDRATADDPRLAAELRRAGLIYLAGGSPAHLLASLVGSACLAAIREALAAGAVLAGSSAGAMVVAAWMRPPSGAWQPALGLAPGLAVLPHHERGGPERAAGYADGLPGGLALLGIDGATAAIEAGPGWLVEGQGGVSVYAPSGAQRYLGGQRFTL